MELQETDHITPFLFRWLSGWGFPVWIFRVLLYVKWSAYTCGMFWCFSKFLPEYFALVITTGLIVEAVVSRWHFEKTWLGIRKIRIYKPQRTIEH